MKIKPLSEIKAFLVDKVKEIGYTLEDVEYKNGDYPTLTFFIDKKGGVDLDGCEKVSNLIDPLLDELDPTYGEAYSLNVSSMGIDRPFKSEEDFTSHLNKMVEVKLKSSVKGKKFFEGILVSFNKENLILKVDGKTTLTLDFKNIVKVNEYIDLNNL